MNFRFADLLAPMSEAEFSIARATGEPFVLRGSADKFEHLFTWSDLNGLLEQHRLAYPRIRVERVGAVAAELTVLDQFATPRGYMIDRVSPDLLYRRLEAGSTLVVDAVNEVTESVRTLLDSVAGYYRSRPQANLYASFGHSLGFGVHWDSRDVFATQVEGRKSWKIFRAGPGGPALPGLSRPAGLKARRAVLGG